MRNNIAMVIAGALTSNCSFSIAYGWSEGIAFFDLFDVGGIVINNSIRFSSTLAWDGTQRTVSMLMTPTLAKVYENSVLKVNRADTYGNLYLGTGEDGCNRIQLGFSDGSWNSNAAKFNEVALLNNQADTVEMLAASVESEYWN